MNRLRAPLVVALLVTAAAALLLHMRAFHFFVTDDAFISFVYSRNLVEHGQLVFNLGEKPVEGYTNFLWTVFLAGWMKLGWKPESSSVAWGTIFALGTMIACAAGTRALRADRARWSAWDALPALILAATPGWACWASGGLETQMFTFFATCGGLLYLVRTVGGAPPPLGSAALYALAALTRPEGNLFFAIVAAHRGVSLILRGRYLPSRRELAWLAIYAFPVGAHFLWRHHYYGWWLPNTFYIKSSGGLAAFGEGVYYLTRFAEAYLVPALLLVSLAPCGFGVRTIDGSREPGPIRFLWFALPTLGVFWLYVASVGGDFMGLFRFVLPSLPWLAIGTALGLRALGRAITDDGGRLLTVPPALVTVMLGLYALNAVKVDRAAQVFLGPGSSDHGIDTPGYLRWYTEDRAAIGRWFGRYGKPDDYAAVGGAGAQVYYSGMRSLDCYGLSDEYIAHHVAPVSTRPGHQKYAPREYQIARRPTLITSNYYRIGIPNYVGDDAAFWRQQGYHYVTVEIPGLSGRYYSFLKRVDRSFGPLGPSEEN